MRLAACKGLASLALILLAATARADSRLDVATQMADTWYAARMFHPGAAPDPRRWDRAFADALEELPPDVEPASLRPILDSWMRSLEDPWSRVVESSGGRARGEIPVERDDGKVTVRLGAIGRSTAIPSADSIRKAAGSLADAGEIVVDLTDAGATPEAVYAGAWVVDHGGLLDAALARPPALPLLRTIAHSGYLNETGTSSGGYHSEYRYKKPSLAIAPRAPHDVPLTFVVDDRTATPILAEALEREGRAKIEVRGRKLPWVDAASFRAPQRIGDIQVLLRQASVAWDLASFPDRASPEKATGGLPTRGERLMAVFKTWWTFDTFHAYRDLADRPWRGALRPALEAAERATTEEEYEEAIERLVARCDDGHAWVNGGVRRTRAHPALSVRLLDAGLVVTALGPVGNADVRVGDVVDTIDGMPVADRLARLRETHAHSGEPGLRNQAALLLLAGDEGTMVKLGLRRDGARHDVALERLPRGRETVRTHDAAYRVLPSGLGYIDLTRLEVADVPAAFEALAATPGIVMDMRGYPRGTAWSVAPRLAPEPSLIAARFARPVALPPSSAWGDVRERFEFVQRIPAVTPPRYRGPTVMLIDERAISQSEHSGLFYRAANGTRFVGTPTAGTNGDVTYFSIPGGLTISFSGHAVTWPDGKPLQRVGLQPDVRVEPTIEGLRAGHDEVLEAAVRDLEATLGKR